VAKTRLGRAIGPRAAVTLYEGFLRDLAARFAGSPFPVGWYVTPADAWMDVASLVDGCGDRVLVQGDGDWTARQRRLFAGAATRGEDAVVLLASDSPHVAVETVSAAFEALSTSDVVLGRTHDGGYYLLGMRGWHDVLAGVEMSTGTVSDRIVRHARRLGASIAALEPTFDVDGSEDLAPLVRVAATRDDLPATRRALEALGVLVAAEAA
jgi:uncharacterized protein